MNDADIAQADMEAIDRLMDKERGLRQVLTADDSADNCEECGLEIPSARQLAAPGCTLCIDCAGIFEEKRL